jgi:hypothetical protein
MSFVVRVAAITATHRKPPAIISAPVEVANLNTTDSSSTPTPIDQTAAIPDNSMLVIAGAGLGRSSLAPTSLTDNLGNTYPISTIYNSGNGQIWWSLLYFPAGVASGIKWTLETTGAGSKQVRLVAITGLDPAINLGTGDGTAIGPGATGASANPSSAVPSVGGSQLILSCTTVQLGEGDTVNSDVAFTRALTRTRADIGQAYLDYLIVNGAPPAPKTDTDVTASRTWVQQNIALRGG